MRLKLFSFLFGCLICLNVFATVETQVDKTNVAPDETFTLIITSKDHLHLSPDITPLNKDFYVVGTSQNSSFNFINGSASMETQWQISLMPKSSGDLQIPALEVGKEKTAPQVIHVAANNNMLPVTHNSDIFLETNITPKEAFLHEQFIYTVKVYFARTIGNAFLMAPEMPDAKIIQNGQDIVYSVTKKGRYFRVLERSYLITPEKTGHFQITSPTLKGYLETAADQYDLYGISSHAVKPIKVVGPNQTVIVKPKPAGFAGHWLPARKIEMDESWDPSPPVFREGEPVTRAVTITAIGSTADQIPNIATPQTDGLNSYVQTAKRDNDTNNGQQVGHVTQNIVYIPTRTGQLTLPAIKIKWWNSITKKEETTSLPAKKVTVQPALIQTPQASQSRVAPIMIQSAAPKTTHKLTLWQIVALVATLLWVATLVLWRLQANRHRQPKNINGPQFLKSISSQLKDQCLQNNAKKTRDLFLKWAAGYWKDEAIHSLADVVAILEREQAQQFSEQIMLLEGRFYGNNTEKWQGNEFWRAFNDYLEQKNHPEKDQQDPLPPLYCKES